MMLIKQLSEYIEDEICDVEKYAKMAIEVRDLGYPNIAEGLYNISRQENEHINKLHQFISGLIQDYKAKNGEPPADMLAVYGYLHKQQIEKLNNAKRYCDMFTGK